MRTDGADGADGTSRGGGGERPPSTSSCDAGASPLLPVLRAAVATGLEGRDRAREGNGEREGGGAEDAGYGGWGCPADQGGGVLEG